VVRLQANRRALDRFRVVDKTTGTSPYMRTAKGAVELSQYFEIVDDLCRFCGSSFDN
jgi:hypothetical protein